MNAVITTEGALLQQQLNESRLEVAVLSHLPSGVNLTAPGAERHIYPAMELFDGDNEFEAEYNIGGELILRRKNERM